MASILITGGTGMIGKALTSALLAKGHTVIILTRNLPALYIPNPASGISYAEWNIERQAIDPGVIGQADYIVHLAGAGIADKRWTKKRKLEIVNSRVKSGELLVKALKENNNKVKAVISASAIGWYGDDRNLIPAHSASKKPISSFVETSPPADDFLGQTCQQWEESLAPLKDLGKRVVHIRTGIVLSKEGGALVKFLQPLRFGVAAIPGNGKQIISWIHVDDLAGIYLKAIEDDQLYGAYNAVAPAPVSTESLVLQLAKINKGKFFIPVHIPAFILRIFLGEVAGEVLKSATVSCAKIQVAGYSFLHPNFRE